jgi:hypothetical protein
MRIFFKPIYYFISPVIPAAGFCLEIGCAFSRALEGGKRGALADFFIG